jgi:hypothetical protein
VGSFSVFHWMLVLLLVIVIFAEPKLRNPPRTRFHAAVHPVFSSVTTTGSEAEHINDKLPKWPSRFILTVTLFVLVVVASWTFS